MAIGIYALYWEKPDVIYIGQSINIDLRFKQHLNSFKNNKASKKLMECYLEHGEPTLNILETCNIIMLDSLEDLYINEFNSIEKGLNSVSGGIGGINFLSPGTYYTQESIEKSFLMLINPLNSSKYISEQTNLSIGMINSISRLHSHCWLEEKYHLEYKILRELKSNRASSCQYLKYNNIKVVGPSGNIYLLENQSVRSFAREFGLDNAGFSKIFNGSRKQYKGWKIYNDTY